VTTLEFAVILNEPADGKLTMQFHRDAQASVSPLLLGIVTDVHITDPDNTLTVSPLDAFEMQVTTLDWSMVVVHVGLLPVQDANALGAPRSSTRIRNLRPKINTENRVLIPSRPPPHSYTTSI